MGETADKIETFIDQQRQNLGSNLKELESKVKSTADWRTHVRKHTGLALGIAVGVGVLVGTLALLGSRKPRRRAPTTNPEAGYARREVAVRPPRKEMELLRGYIEQLSTAFIDWAAAGLVKYLDTILPGFGRQVEKRLGQH